MSHLLAFCDNPACGAIVSLNNFFDGGPNSKLTVKNVGGGPCPYCGSRLTVPDGEYFVDGNVLTRISSLPESVDVLKKLQRMLKEALLDENKRFDALAAIRQAAPNLNLPDTSDKGKTDIVAWFQAIIALITLAILIQQSYFKKEDADDKYKDILIEENRWYRQQLQQKQEVSTAQETKNKVSFLKVAPALNKPCPYCNSGKLYKRCHGKLQK